MAKALKPAAESPSLVEVDGGELEAAKTALAAKTLECEQMVASFNDAFLKKAAEADAATARVAELEAEVARLKAARPATETAAEPAPDLVEIVAVPPNEAVKAPELWFEGTTVKRAKDADGFWHYHAPRKFAEIILGNTSGVRYLLVGPDDKMTAKRFGSKRTETVTVYRHAKASYPKGGTFWQPVIVEESKANADA